MHLLITTAFSICRRTSSQNEPRWKRVHWHCLQVSRRSRRRLLLVLYISKTYVSVLQKHYPTFFFSLEIVISNITLQHRRRGSAITYGSLNTASYICGEWIDIIELYELCSSRKFKKFVLYLWLARSTFLTRIWPRQLKFLAAELAVKLLRIACT